MTGAAANQIISENEAQTRCLGTCLGKAIQHGLAVRLRGALGSGKTCFVQGLARGLAVPETFEITSPTYTLINAYPARLTFYHVDLYRIGSMADADSIGLWDLFAPDAVVAVEWSDRLDEEAWPDESLCISFQIDKDDRRLIDLIGYGLQMDDLINQVVAQHTDKCANILK